MTENIDRIRLEAIEKRKSQAIEAVQSRKRKLSELYMVSNLGKLRTVTDSTSLKIVKDSLCSFLERNDIQNGHAFNLDTLLVDKPGRSVEATSVRAHSPNNAASSKRLDYVRAQTADTPVSTPLKKPREIENKEDTNFMDTNKVQQLIQQRTATSLPRKSIVKRRGNSHKSLFNIDDKEAIETNIVLLKEFLPAKVSEATSLAELYYLAQTLPLVKLVPSTHKVVTSNMYETALTEGKISVVHSRIEELKRQGKWSLRQPSKFTDPFKRNIKTHWDGLLSEMNWMASDFKEGRKLRIATCAFIADGIRDYWKYGKLCCIRRKPIRYLPKKAEMENNQITEHVSSSESDKSRDIFDNNHFDGSKFIDNGSADITMLIKRPALEDDIMVADFTATSQDDYDKLKNESPFKVIFDTNIMTQTNKVLFDAIPTFSAFQSFDPPLDSPLIPVSKALIPIEDDSWYNIHFKQIEDTSDVIIDQQKGLFGFSSQKKISTSTKPPPPPSLKYLDLRTPTIWLPEDDQDLIEFVNQFSFNWGVVSAHLSKRPTKSYSSNIERRTPWQCFERYIQLNDTFQINDMKGQHTQSAMKWLEHAHHIQATTKRRISPLGVGVDSIQRGHKRLRWASMFEAVRKCMRKRESVSKPNAAQARRADESGSSLTAPTPNELSKLKYERDKSIQDAYLQNNGNGFRARPQQSSKQIPSQSQAQAPSQAQPLSQTHAQAQAKVQAQVQAQTRQVAHPHPNSRTQPSIAVPQPSSQAQTYAHGGNQIKRAIPAAPTSSHLSRSNSNNYPQTNVPVSSNPTVNQVTGSPYTQEQIQEIIQMRQRKGIPPNVATSNGTGSVSVQGSSSPTPSSLKAQLVPNNSISNAKPLLTPRTNSNTSQIVPTNTADDGRKIAFVPAHVSAIINRIQSQNPNMSKQDVTKIAAQYLANLQAKQNKTHNHNNNTIVQASQSPQLRQVVANASSSPDGTSLSSKTIPVPTPQQILLQQQSHEVPHQKAPQQQSVNLQNGSQRIQTDQSIANIPRSSSPSTSHNIQSPASLTPQQKVQLNMLKTLQAEQVEKRKQGTLSTSAENSTKPNFERN